VTDPFPLTREASSVAPEHTNSVHRGWPPWCSSIAAVLLAACYGFESQCHLPNDKSGTSLTRHEESGRGVVERVVAWWTGEARVEVGELPHLAGLPGGGGDLGTVIL